MIKVGAKVCIVLKYTENDFEVEFFDENDETITADSIERMLYSLKLIKVTKNIVLLQIQFSLN